MGRPAINLVGLHKGKSRVVEKVESSKAGVVLWKCECNCGEYFTKTATQISKASSISCGCDSVRSSDSIRVGERFERLTILEIKTEDKYPHVFARCDCGVEKYFDSINVLRGKTKSCGCLRSDTSTTHGHSKTKDYKIYHGMISRCYNQNNVSYENYGGRGVIVCDRWLGSDGFKNFMNDMGACPDGMSIDRVDVNGVYEPVNCRWATGSVQSFNRRISKRNTSGRQNVFWEGRRDRWIVKVTKDYREHYFGGYASFDDAVKAAERAELLLYGEVHI